MGEVFPAFFSEWEEELSECLVVLVDDIVEGSVVCGGILIFESREAVIQKNQGNSESTSYVEEMWSIIFKKCCFYIDYSYLYWNLVNNCRNKYIYSN